MASSSTQKGGERKKGKLFALPAGLNTTRRCTRGRSAEPGEKKEEVLDHLCWKKNRKKKEEPEGSRCSTP